MNSPMYICLLIQIYISIQCQLSISFRRRLGYFMFHTYIPTCLIVMMSWISFWIKPEVKSFWRCSHKEIQIPHLTFVPANILLVFQALPANILPVFQAVPANNWLVSRLYLLTFVCFQAVPANIWLVSILYLLTIHWIPGSTCSCDAGSHLTSHSLHPTCQQSEVSAPSLLY